MRADRRGGFSQAGAHHILREIFSKIFRAQDPVIAKSIRVISKQVGLANTSTLSPISPSQRGVLSWENSFLPLRAHLIVALQFSSEVGGRSDFSHTTSLSIHFRLPLPLPPSFQTSTSNIHLTPSHPFKVTCLPIAHISLPTRCKQQQKLSSELISRHFNPFLS
ncbi:hypothetical protein VTI74DRAFT_9585 [Chaetomium olivicolor]